MTQNLHVCTICFRLEVAYDVISGQHIKTQKNHFVTAEAEAASDIDDSIKRKRIRVSLNYVTALTVLFRTTL